MGEGSPQAQITTPEKALWSSYPPPLLSFFETYVDGLHQDKEERVLFPRLRERAAEKSTTFEALAEEHHQERLRLEGMRTCLEGASYGDGLSLDTFLVNARSYVALQRSHLRYENRWLLPLVERLLDKDDDLHVCEGFRDLERRFGTCFVRAAQEAMRSLHVVGERQAS